MKCIKVALVSLFQDIYDTIFLDRSGSVNVFSVVKGLQDKFSLKTKGTGFKLSLPEKKTEFVLEFSLTVV